jgi:hypothetical protein
MQPDAEAPRVFRTLRGEAIETTTSSYGSVGRLFTGEGLELVWVRKENEEVDPGWFSQSVVDLIVVIQGGLRCEFDDPRSKTTDLRAGDVLVLPANRRCRAYRWPREQREATIFIAAYPQT